MRWGLVALGGLIVLDFTKPILHGLYYVEEALAEGVVVSWDPPDDSEDGGDSELSVVE